jgi:hypothetical protein
VVGGIAESAGDRLCAVTADDDQSGNKPQLAALERAGRERTTAKAAADPAAKLSTSSSLTPNH